LQLQRGTRLGAYEIDEPLGSGGMGEVYRARDERLNRSVAIKILPAQRATTRDGIARFEREARAASALNHPHILHIYDIGSTRISEDSEPIHYIAMELVDGEILRTKIERRTDFRQLLEPLIDVAEALAKAHAAGIIHRDLKPENIMISRDGYAKVLDFGLAKLMDGPADLDAAAQTLARTGSGIVLGTVGYMSPEQVDGKPVDARTDIFSFGCILHEAVTDTRAFSGRSAVDTMHRILHNDPPPMPGVSPDLQRIVRKCLAKDPAQRYQHIKEVAVDLREVRRLLESGSAASRRRSVAAWAVFGGIAVLIVLAAIGVIITARQPLPPAPVVQPFSAIDIERATFTGDVATSAISRSGHYLAYTRTTGNQSSLWLKQFKTDADVQLIRPGDLKVGYVSFSPDEDYIYFLAVGDVYRIPTVGGSPQKIMQGVTTSITFAPDGRRFAFVRRPAEHKNEMVTADLDGGNEQVVYSGEESIWSPAWSPRGDEIVCLSFEVKRQPVSLSVVNPRDHKLSILRETHAVHVWMPDGTALIAPKVFPEPSQQLRYVPYPRGKERRITTDLSNYIGASVTADGRTIASVQQQGSRSIWLLPGGDFSASKQLTPAITGRSDGVGMVWAPNGTLIYFAVDREIHLNSLSPEASPKTLWSEPYIGIMLSSPPSISADGKKIAYTSHTDGSIWIIDADGGNRRRLTNGEADLDPAFLPDGSAVIYTMYKRQGKENPMLLTAGVRKVSVSGGTPTILVENVNLARLSPEGKRLVMWRPGFPQRLMLTAIDGSGARELPPFSNARSGARFQWSPDSASIDYISDDSQLWRQPLNGGPARKLTNVPDGIDEFAWSRDGSQLAVRRDTQSSDVVLIRDRRR
jgi:serine/threonine protein kinase/Tol biopolymer transport system component